MRNGGRRGRRLRSWGTAPPSGRGDKLRFDRKVLSKGDEPRNIPGAGGMTQGSNDVYPIHIKGKRFLAAQEPWHGDEIVVYAEKGGQ